MLTKLPIDLLTAETHHPGIAHYDGKIFDIAALAQAFSSGIETGYYDEMSGILTIKKLNGDVVDVTGFLTASDAINGVIPGPPGRDGRDGVDGVDGIDGLPGDRGLPGYDGIMGPTGERGPICHVYVVKTGDTECIYYCSAPQEILDIVDAFHKRKSSPTHPVVKTSWAEGIKTVADSTNMLCLNTSAQYDDSLIYVCGIIHTSKEDANILGSCTIDGDDTLPTMSGSNSATIGSAIIKGTLLVFARSKRVARGEHAICLTGNVKDDNNNFLPMSGQRLTCRLVAICISKGEEQIPQTTPTPTPTPTTTSVPTPTPTPSDNCSQDCAYDIGFKSEGTQSGLAVTTGVGVPASFIIPESYCMVSIGLQSTTTGVFTVPKGTYSLYVTSQALSVYGGYTAPGGRTSGMGNFHIQFSVDGGPSDVIGRNFNGGLRINQNEQNLWLAFGQNIQVESTVSITSWIDEGLYCTIKFIALLVRA